MFTLKHLKTLRHDEDDLNKIETCWSVCVLM